VQENETNSLLLLNAELQKVKKLEGVRSANCLELQLQSDYFNLQTSNLVKNLKLASMTRS
jgi:hypothetical protein